MESKGSRKAKEAEVATEALKILAWYENPIVFCEEMMSFATGKDIKLIDKQKEVVWFLKQEDKHRGIWVAARKIGKCISGSTPVYLSNGQIEEPTNLWFSLSKYKEVKQLSSNEWIIENPGIELLSFNGSHFVSSTPTIFYKQEYKGKLLKIVTRHGRTVTITPEHPLLTPNGWIKAHELLMRKSVRANKKPSGTFYYNVINGSQIAINFNTSGINEEVNNSELAELVGYIIAEGDTINGCSIYTKNSYILNRVSSLLVKYLWASPIIQEDKRTGVWEIRCNLGFLKHLESYFGSGLSSRSKDKHIPSKLLRGDKLSILSFLGAYINSDGYVFDDYAQIYTTSIKTMNGLMFMLNRLGILAGCRQKKQILPNSSIYTSYEITISSKDFTKLGDIPNLRPDFFIKINNSLDKQKNSVGLPNDLFDEVIDIKEVEAEGAIYDFVIPGLQNFIAGHGGGVIVHNTSIMACMALWMAVPFSLVRHESSRILIVSSSADQAQILYDWISKFFTHPLITKTIEGDPLSKVTIFKHGSQIRRVPSTSQAVSGWATDMLIIDEAIHADVDVINTAIPQLSLSPYSKLLLISTAYLDDPLHLFFEIWDNPDKYGYYRFKPVSQEECDWTSDEERRLSKLQMTEDEYAVHYLGEVRKASDIMCPFNLEDLRDHCRLEERPNPIAGQIFWGIDWGELVAPTVISIGQIINNSIVVLHIEEMNKTRFPEQHEIIAKLATVYPPSLIYADNSHPGEVERLQMFLKLPAVGIAFKTFQPRMIENLKWVIENHRLFIWKEWYKTLQQLVSFRYDKKKGTDHVDCYDDKTEVLTKEGWKLFSDISKSDIIATLNKDGYLEYQHPTDIISYNYQGKMIKINNKQINLCITPNHKVYVSPSKQKKKPRHIYLWNNYSLIPISEILDKHVAYKRNALWKGTSSNMFVLPATKSNRLGWKSYPIEISIKDWIEFMGYYLSEGNTSRNRVSIAQSPGKYKDIIRTCLLRLPFKWREFEDQFYTENKQLADYLRPLGKSYEKYIQDSLKSLSPELLRAMWKAYLLGDGYRGIGYTTSKRLADDWQECLLKIGISGNVVPKKQSIGYIRGRKINSKHQMYEIRSIYHNNPQVNHHSNRKSYEIIDYNGMVYCVTVPNHIVYVRRNGIPCWSGNSLQLLCYACKDLIDRSQGGKYQSIGTRPLFKIGHSIEDRATSEIPKELAYIHERWYKERFWCTKCNRDRDKCPCPKEEKDKQLP